MALMARDFLCVDCTEASAPENVYSHSNGFEMIGPNTSPITAKMIEREALWDQPNHKFIDSSMSFDMTTIQPD